VLGTARRVTTHRATTIDPVTTFADKIHFPGPWEKGDVIVFYFQTHPLPVLICLFLQFGALVPLGTFTASVVSRLHFLGVRAAC